MVERKVCSFCGREIEPGTGSLFIRKDGSTFQYCSSKCRKNSLHLGRVPRRVRWTQQYASLKAAGKSKEARAPAKDKEKALVEEKKPAEPASAKEPEKPKARPAQPKPAAQKEKAASKAEKPEATEGAKPKAKPKRKEG
ncbi:MAG: hypothetical protein HZB92_00375 [Euryarchaeota archaeon]|nr:hypothetical protein [Euryarchaeota archaeon]